MTKTSLPLAVVTNAVAIADQIVALAADSGDPKAIETIINRRLAQRADAIWSDQTATDRPVATMDDVIKLLVNVEGLYVSFTDAPVAGPIPEAERNGHVDKPQTV